MIFGHSPYDAAVARTHETHHVDEYLIWRSPPFNMNLRWIWLIGGLFVGTVLMALLTGGSMIAGFWMIASTFFGVWRLFTPLTKFDCGYTVTSKRIIRFRLRTMALFGGRTSYNLCYFHPPTIERNLIWRNFGDLRFDRASSNPGSWRDSWPVRALSVLFESVRIRDVRNPEIVAVLISKDKSIEWGEPT